MTFELFTDGGTWPNPGPGGWSFILKDSLFGNVVKKSGYVAATTNNKMELTAVIEGLNEIPEGSQVYLYSDSRYIVDGITQWRHAWKKRNWQGVKNEDLWKQLDALLGVLHVDASWVRGHTGHPENEECDQMAWAAYRGVSCQPS